MRVFLSYARADKELAKKLGDQLAGKGFDVWDPGREILPGDNWALKLGDALEMSDAVVVILSPDSVQSESVQREIQFALGDPKKQGRLFPVLARRATQVPWILKKLKILDAGRGIGNVTWKIASALRAARADRIKAIRTHTARRKA